jgi:hypothetical protein
VAAVHEVEVVDARGTRTLGNRSAYRHGNLLRMVCGAVPVALAKLHPDTGRLGYNSNEEEAQQTAVAWARGRSVSTY